LVVLELHGSGGHIFADVTDEQAKKADLGVGKCFLAPIGKLEEQRCRNIFPLFVNPGNLCGDNLIFQN